MAFEMSTSISGMSPVVGTFGQPYDPRAAATTSSGAGERFDSSAQGRVASSPPRFSSTTSHHHHHASSFASSYSAVHTPPAQGAQADERDAIVGMKTLIAEQHDALQRLQEQVAHFQEANAELERRVGETGNAYLHELQKQLWHDLDRERKENMTLREEIAVLRQRIVSAAASATSSSSSSAVHGDDRGSSGSPSSTSGGGHPGSMTTAQTTKAHQMLQQHAEWLKKELQLSQVKAEMAEAEVEKLRRVHVKAASMLRAQDAEDRWAKLEADNQRLSDEAAMKDGVIRDLRQMIGSLARNMHVPATSAAASRQTSSSYLFHSGGGAGASRGSGGEGGGLGLDGASRGATQSSLTARGVGVSSGGSRYHQSQTPTGAVPSRPPSWSIGGSSLSGGVGGAGGGFAQVDSVLMFDGSSGMTLRR